MSFPRYPKYKDSGVEWLGPVPEHWDVLPLKRIVAVPITDGPHETPEFVDQGVPFVSAEAVSSGRIDFAKIRACITAEDNARYSQKYSPRLNDIYMVKSGASTGTTAIVEERTDFNIWSPLAAIRCADVAVPHYILNFMRSKNFLEGVTLNWSFGTQQNIGMKVIENLSVATPPYSEQIQIASFLTRETAKIDALVAGQQRLIELLDESIKSRVLSAYDKGRGTQIRLQHSVQITARPVRQQEGEWYTPLGLFNKGRGLFHKEAREKKDMGDSDFFWVEEGDLIISGQFAWEGAVAIAGQEETGCVVSHRYPVLRGLPSIALTEYVFALLSTTHGDFLLNENSRGAAGRNRPLNIHSLLKERILVPPMDVQQDIAGLVHLRRHLLGELATQSRLLGERRSALISAAVTGQIDVRGLVPAEAA